MAAKLPMPFGAYALLKALGQGAMGDVHLARPYNARRGIPTPIVIKRLHGELASNPDFVRRFQHEAEIAVSVDSPHVAKVYDVGKVGETLYIAMEHVNGWPLSKLIEAVIASGRHASIGAIIDMVSGGLEGLAALHGARDVRTGKPLGVVHRDISPKNLMVGEDGKMRLIDLGLGKSNVQDWKTRTGVVMGSVGYMPPEQVTAELVDQRADIYAMAAVLFELLALRHYIPRGPIPVMLRNSVSPTFEPPSRYRPDVPQGLDEVLRKALAHEPSARHQNASELLAAIRAVVPERADKKGNAMAGLIGELFQQQLPTRREELSQLLRMPLPEVDDGPEPEHTVTYVMAEGVAPMGSADMPRVRRSDPARNAGVQVVPVTQPQVRGSDMRPMPPPRAPDDYTLQPMPMAEAVFGGTPSQSLEATAKASVPIWVLGLAVVAALGVGVIGAALLLGTAEDAPAPEYAAEPPSAPLVIGVAAAAAVDAGVEPTPSPSLTATPSPSPSTTPTPTPSRRPTPSPSTTPTPSPSTKPSISPTPTPMPRRTEEATPEAVQASARRVMERVQAALGVAEGDPERTKTLSKMLNDLTMEARSSNTEAAAAKVREIERAFEAMPK